MSRKTISILMAAAVAVFLFTGAVFSQTSKPRKSRNTAAAKSKSRYANQETSYRKRRTKSAVQYNSTDWDFRRRKQRKKRRPVQKPRTTNLLPYMEQSNRKKR